MPDDINPLQDLVSRVAAPEPISIETGKESRESLGHVGDALAWLATARGSWPARAPQRAVVIASDRDPLRVDGCSYATLSCEGDALTRILAGAGAVDRAVDSGADAIILQAPTPTSTDALAVVALLTASDASSVVRPMLDTALWMTTVAGIRDTMRIARPHLADAHALLDSVGDRQLAGICGALIGAAARRTPAILDTTATLAAALIAHRLCYRAVGWWWASQRPAGPAADAALDRLELHPFVDLHLDDVPGIAPAIMIDAVEQATQRLPS